MHHDMLQELQWAHAQNLRVHTVVVLVKSVLTPWSEALARHLALALAATPAPSQQMLTWIGWSTAVHHKAHPWNHAPIIPVL